VSLGIDWEFYKQEGEWCVCEDHKQGMIFSSDGRHKCPLCEKAINPIIMLIKGIKK